METSCVIINSILMENVSGHQKKVLDIENEHNIYKDIILIVYIMLKTGLRISDVLELKHYWLIKLNRESIETLRYQQSQVPTTSQLLYSVN